MPTGICNTCNELIHWKKEKNIFIKDLKCKCGSKDLSYVSGSLQEDGSSWVYHDRKGTVKKIVPRDTAVI